MVGKLYKKVAILSLFILTLMILVIGNHNYQSKIEKTVEVAVAENKSYLAEKEAERKKLEEEQKAKEKAIYDKHKGKELVYFPMGDSLSVGLFSVKEDSRFVSMLAKQIEEKIGYDVKIDDSTVKSNTGLKDNGIPNIPKMLEAEPDLITIEFGTNDLNESLKDAYSTPEEFKDNLTTLLEEIQTGLENKPKVILVTTWRGYDKSTQYDAIIKEVGEEYGVPVADIKSVWENVETVGPEGEETFKGISDKYHPNDLGHKLISDKIFAQAYKILQ